MYLFSTAADHLSSLSLYIEIFCSGHPRSTDLLIIFCIEAARSGVDLDLSKRQMNTAEYEDVHRCNVAIEGTMLVGSWWVLSEMTGSDRSGRIPRVLDNVGSLVRLGNCFESTLCQMESS